MYGTHNMCVLTKLVMKSWSLSTFLIGLHIWMSSLAGSPPFSKPSMCRHCRKWGHSRLRIAWQLMFAAYSHGSRQHWTTEGWQYWKIWNQNSENKLSISWIFARNGKATQPGDIMISRMSGLLNYLHITAFVGQRRFSSPQAATGAYTDSQIT